MEPVMKALAWTFVHSLWQGLAAALLAAIIISATKKTTARLRYNLLGMVLLAFLITSVGSFFIQLQEQQQIASSTLQQTSVPDSNTADTTGLVVPGDIIANITNWFNNNTNLLLLVWVIFFLVNCLKLFTGLAAVNRLRNYKVHPVTEEWKLKFEQLKNHLSIRQSITLLQSELVKVPVALGYLKPVILIPLGLLANIPAEQAETILLHELGHIRRKDYLANFIQHFAEAIFFFNPGMLWISSLLRQEREACCDDIVVANSTEKRNYLNALVAFQEYSMRQTSYAMAISSKRHYLLNRVKRIMTNENKGINFFEKAILLAGIILFSAFTFIKYEKDAKELIVQQIHGPVLQNVTIKPEVVLPKQNKMKLNHKTPAVTVLVDTLPAKKDTTKLKPLVKNKELSEAGKKLQEIIKLKEKIGEKKESIGKKKELMKSNEGKQKDEITKKIEKERKGIEGEREKLEIKRAEYENLKKQEKNTEEREKKQEEKMDKKNAGAAKVEIVPFKKFHVEKADIIKVEKISEDKKLIIFKLNNWDVKKKDIKWEAKKQDSKFNIDEKLKMKPPPVPKEPKSMDSPSSPRMKAKRNAVARI